ncbi:MAG TPA: BON domain-containing protein [Thermoanaerobaculia bacterium]|nr:BON domain-containing protein [Thermoanaerobaculia bacterium]
MDETPTPPSREPLLYGLAGLVLGAAVGAGLTFLLDPANGRRRRAQIADQLVHARKRGVHAVRDAASDIGQRSRGLGAAVRARLLADRADARTLEARVRARLGRIATNPGAIAVVAEGTRVTLRGSVPPDELDDVLDVVAAVKGVHEVYNLLQVQLAAPVPGHH